MVAAYGVWGSPLHAQQPRAGAIGGQVVGPDAKPLADAVLNVPGTSHRTVTDRSGRFHIPDVAPGSHLIVVRYLGFRPDTLPVEVLAGQTRQVAVTLKPAPYDLDRVVVEGARRGQARALNQQRTATNIQNVIAQEQIDRFPDANIADGLKRVPGVTASQDYGEASGVMLRGLSSGLNSVTIDGERVPSNTSGGRSVSLGNILSDMVGAIEVHKALTADMDADAIGGSINLITKIPTEGRRLLSGSIGGGYNELRAKNQIDASLTYGERFGKLGVLASGSIVDSKRQEESLHYGWDGNTLEDFTLYNYNLDRTRLGTSGMVDYQLGDRSRVYVRGMYNQFDDNQYTPKFTHSLRGGDSLTTDGVIDAPTLRTGRQRNHTQKIITLGAGGAHVLNGVDVDYSASYAKGGDNQPTYFNASWRSIGDFDIDLRDHNFPLVTPANGTDPYRESAFKLSDFSVEREESGDRDVTGQLNLKRPYRTSAFAGNIKVGGKVREKNNFRVARESAFRPLSGTNITLDQYPRTGFGNTDFYEGHYNFGPGYDPRSLSQFHLANPQLFEEFVDREKVVDEYNARERVAAVYGMVDATFGRLTVNTGLRYEHTAIGYDANEVQFDADGEFVGNVPLSQEQSYGGFYPSLHLLYRVSENTNVRAAATRTLARPGYSSLAPYELVLKEDEEISRGNPALRPYHALNFDLLAEHYLSSVGLVAGGIFYKKLNDVIIGRTFKQVGGSFDGYQVEQPQNAANASVWGIESTWQQQFTSLPGLFGGLGLYANYTFTKSRLELPGAEARELSLPSQIPHAANVALLYEKYGVSSSLSLNYQAGFVDDVGGSADEDEYFGSRRQWDISLGKTLRSGVMLYTEVNNLTNEPYQFYVGRNGQSTTPLENAIYGRWGTVGLRFNY